MGNQQPYLSGIKIDEKCMEISDFWSHHSATISSAENATKLSVLVGELFVDNPFWTACTPLEKYSKNLMIYRHPCIVKYISSWHRGSKFYLAIEEATPLNQVLNSLSTLQIFVGLHSILKALCFLQERASVSHNNVCVTSIYVTKDGNWKLGGMEFLCTFKDLSGDYLKKSKSNRYNRGIDPNEDSFQKSSRKDLVDIYAFINLAIEVLDGKIDDTPNLVEFFQFCQDEIKNVDITLRPTLKSLLEHAFFNNEFIAIHSFLIELPLKTEEEKTNFFQTLLDRLLTFPEVTVAKQLGSLLLSRIVLLNKTAQNELLPLMLCPKIEFDAHTRELFSEDVFKKYIIPRVLEIFPVRDTQIRLLLLKHFPFFIHCISKESLQGCVLPELLVGIKDTNDQLVSVTLNILALLVPILGAATVIGGNRAKLFNDGRPIVHAPAKSRTERQQTPTNATQSNLTAVNLINLPERPRPDGEEEETSAEEVDHSVEEDLENWDNWDSNPPTNVGTESLPSSPQAVDNDSEELKVNVVKNALPDISDLDIKNQNVTRQADDIDFFQDMEPVIEPTSKFLIATTNGLETSSVSKINLSASGDLDGDDGWVDEEWG